MRLGSYPNDTKKQSLGSRVQKAIMKSYRFHVPKYDLPLRLRPWFLVFTCAVMVLLAFLGFTDFSRALPLNDKSLHFLCFMIATGVFYFIVDIEESARRVWFWRYFNLIFTFITCLLCGGVLSEIVQSALPYKEFQIGDVVANLLGSSIGLTSSYYLERYYRYRREISRLYQPLDNDSLSDFEDDLESFGTRLLPAHRTTRSQASTPRTGSVGINGGGTKTKSSGKKKGNVRFAPQAGVWLFEIGNDFDSDDEENDREEVANPQREMAGDTEGRQEQSKQAVLLSSSA